MNTRAFAAAICLAVVHASSFAYDIEVDGIYYNVLSEDNKTCEVIESSTKYNGQIKIPQNVTIGDRQYVVTYIGKGAFRYCKDLTSISLPNTIDSIGSQAFAECTGLKELTSPSSLKSIGTFAFYGCTSLIELSFPQTLISIGSYAFYGCKNLTNVTIPEAINNLGFLCFGGNETPLIVNYNAIECLSANQVFSVNNTNTVAEIIFGGKVKRIPANLCAHSTRLTQIEIPISMEQVGSSAFEGCIGIEEIALPKSLNSVGWNAFSDCTKLKVLTFYDAQFGVKAFSGCVSLRTINAMSKTPPISSFDNTFDDVCYKDAILYVPKNTKSEYQSTCIWKKFSNIIEKDFEFVEDVSADGRDIRVAVRDGQVEVSGADASEEVKVYGMGGMEIYRGTDSTIALPTKGVYIVKVAGRTFKVAL